jgi:hypothetical protein
VLRSASSSTSYKHLAQPDRGLLEITSEEVAAAAGEFLQERHA